MVEAHWRIGELIVRHEQRGRVRAAYREAALEKLAVRLTKEFGRGVDVRNLRYMRQFFLSFELANENRNALRSKSAVNESPIARPELSWTHYRLPLGVADPAARAWFMHEAAESPLVDEAAGAAASVLYCERRFASRSKAPVRSEGQRPRCVASQLRSEAPFRPASFGWTWSYRPGIVRSGSGYTIAA